MNKENKYRKNKYSEEFVRTFLKEIGCELLSPYTGVKNNFEYKCSCGEMAVSNFDRFINRGQKGCKKCSGKRSNEHNKLTFVFVKNYFVEQNCILLEETYINSKTKMKYICNCGDIDYKAWNHFKQGQRCKKCATRQNIENQRHNFDDVKKIFDSHGFILLDSEYFSMRNELNYICTCGNKVKKSLHTVVASPKCNCEIKYSKPLKRKYTKEELIEYFWKFFIELGKYPTVDDFKNNKNYPSISSYQRCWGGYNNFLKEIGVLSDNGWYIDDENILKEFYHLNDIELINSLLSKRRSESTIRHIANLLGLKLSHEARYGYKDYSKENLLELLNSFVEKYNYTPTEKEFYDEYPKVPVSLAKRHFGSWNNALIEANIEVKVRTYNFTEDDYLLMKEMYQNGESNITIAKYFDIPSANILYHFRKIGLGYKNVRWTEDDIEYLKNSYTNEPLDEILNNLPNFTLEKIFTKASKLGLKRNNTNINIQKEIASDGTVCLSYSEYKIHEILLYNNIIVEKEIYYKDIFDNENLGKLRCDWLIDNGNIIIEYFGMNTANYIRKAKRKKKICEQNNKPLISLYYYDLRSNFKGLIKKFKVYGYDLIIPNFLLEEFIKQQNKELKTQG